MGANTALEICLLLGAGGGLVIYIIAADKMRFLARFELRQWREQYYLRALPNFLQALHDNHFNTPWPRKRNAVSAAFFRFRTTGFLKRRPLTLRRAFLQQHIVLFSLLEILRPHLQDFILNEQQKIAGARVMEMEDTLDRDRLLGFIEHVRRLRQHYHAHLLIDEKRTLVEIIDRRLIATLRATHAIFQEHGFSLLPEFTELRRWEQMTGPELVQELPRLPLLRETDRAGPKAPRQGVSG